MMKNLSLFKFLMIFPILVMLTGCAPQSRLGMIVDKDTGVQYGSTIERNIVVDPSLFQNRRIKLRIRNTSGEMDFGIKGFRQQLLSAFSNTGYDVKKSDDFGILVDVNVMYAGHASRNLSKEFAFLGGAAGGLVVGSGNLATAGAIIGGATLGTVLGSHVSEDTYIVVSEVTIGVVDQTRGKKDKTLVFGARERKIKVQEREFKGFTRRARTEIAVYAGGRNISIYRVSSEVNQRLVHIISDVI